MINLYLPQKGGGMLQENTKNGLRFFGICWIAGGLRYVEAGIARFDEGSEVCALLCMEAAWWHLGYVSFKIKDRLVNLLLKERGCSEAAYLNSPLPFINALAELAEDTTEIKIDSRVFRVETTEPFFKGDYYDRAKDFFLKIGGAILLESGMLQRYKEAAQIAIQISDKNAASAENYRREYEKLQKENNRGLKVIVADILKKKKRRSKAQKARKDREAEQDTIRTNAINEYLKLEPKAKDKVILRKNIIKQNSLTGRDGNPIIVDTFRKACDRAQKKKSRTSDIL